MTVVQIDPGQVDIILGCIGFGFGSVFFAILGFFLFKKV